MSFGALNLAITQNIHHHSVVVVALLGPHQKRMAHGLGVCSDRLASLETLDTSSKKAVTMKATRVAACTSPLAPFDA